MPDDGELLPGLNPGVLYEGWGLDVLDEFVGPALRRSYRYDRLTGFFTLNSLLAVAEGIEELWRRGGEMRLIIGIHDVPEEIVEAKQLDESDVETIVEAVRERLLEEVSTVEEEFHRDKLAALAWMLNDGLLQIRVACPVTHARLPREGIFHKKRLIFRDIEDNVLVAVGSPNETAAGFNENIEELTVLRHWEDGQRPIAQPHIDSFEEIWNDRREYLQVVDIDESFADELLDRLGSPDRPPESPRESVADIGDVLQTAERSPAYSVLSFENVGLYPHQERVFVEALSRWPVRVLLADEVGLGKTLEAGAILTYLLRFGGVEEVTILAPANLLKQWHEELHLHFGLEFWRWDSTKREYLSPEGERWEGSMGGDPVGPEAPSRVLISAQLARGTKKKGHIYEDVDRFPDLLLVDEAHAARVRPTLDGSTRPTRLWRTLDDITDRIPHVVFLTATPLQTNLEEYHALLELLGLPGVWKDLEAYEKSLRILAQGEDARSLRNSQWILRLIGATLDGMRYAPDGLSDAEEDLIEVARQAGESPSLDEAKAVMGDWSQAFELLVRLHPAHLLTLRNSRDSLVERGYRFPERRFESPALDVPIEVKRFYDGLHEYIWDAYGQVEEAADPDREISLGFTKSSYHQRTASSLHAATCSLENRLEKIEGIVEGYDADEEILSEEYEEPEFDEEDRLTEAPDAGQNRRLERAKSIESTYIKDLLGRLEDFVEGNGLEDPKMEWMIRLLEDHLPQAGVLIFSRYTDTLDACLEVYRANRSGDLDVGYGMYTGQEAWITSGGRRTDATKEDVKLALEEEEIRLIFCSEAAAEGLNLQAARVMINIDVPWNPAKLEQRIGRIARLGQPADEVLVYNLWYPDSVESKMYSRLTKRKDLYDIAVGQSPEIVSDAIRSRVGSDEGDDGINTEEALERLGEVRQDLQHQAIQEVWGRLEDPIPLSTRVRREFLDLLARHASSGTFEEGPVGRRLVVEDPGRGRIEAGSEPEDRSILTLNHEILDILARAKAFLPTEVELLVLEDSTEGQPLAFCLARDDSIAVVPPSDLPALIGALMRGDAVESITDTDSWSPKGETDLLDELHAASRWLPNHAEMTVPFGSDDDDSDEAPPAWVRSEGLRLRPI